MRRHGQPHRHPHTPDQHPDPKLTRLAQAYGYQATPGRYPTPIRHHQEELQENLRGAVRRAEELEQERRAEELEQERRRARRDRWWALLILLGAALIVWLEMSGRGLETPREGGWPPPQGYRRVR